MNIPWKEYKEFLVTEEKMACSRLLIMIHKDNFPGRPTINQIDDPTYLLCKELTRILMPLKQKAQSYIRSSYHLKTLIDQIQLQDHYIIMSYDMKDMFPSVPIDDQLQLSKKS